MWCFLLFTLFVTVQGRAVNISNTWVLPEEGFPVFYRYFRDRISWYEADAVCQFHHANLVTVDTTAQYDAVRAYLKELDISSAVWVGLIRSNPDGDFTWTDYRGLSGDGYWSSAPDTRSAPLCAAADPTADYRWEARACGGPSVASFICELPVPQWALGNEGCMLRALPALTVLYLPESAAVQLTADCGLAGVKRVQCTGKMKREDLLRDLSCADEDQTTTTFVTSSTAFWPIITDLSISDQEINNDISTEESERESAVEDANQFATTKVSSTDFSNESTETNTQKQLIMANELYKVPLSKNINFDVVNSNNLQSNEINNIVSNDEFYINEHAEKLEDEKNMQHKKLHEELARLGNFETIFNQPSDHFVPPLVMAKAKLSDDMTALSIEEKLAQQLAERQFRRHDGIQSGSLEIKDEANEYSSSETIKNIITTDNPIHTILYTTKLSDVKFAAPKKYSSKYSEVKPKILKTMTTKTYSSGKPNNITTSTPTSMTTIYDAIPTLRKKSEKPVYPHQSSGKDSSLELTVIIKDTEAIEKNETKMTASSIRYDVQNETNSKDNDTTVITNHHIIMNDEVIKIEIKNEKGINHSNIDVTVYEVTTKIPSFKRENKKDSILTPKGANININTTTTTSIAQSGYDNTTSFSGEELIRSSIKTIETTNQTDDVQSTEGTLITIVTNLNLASNASMFGYKGKNDFDDVPISNATTLEEKMETFNETDIIYHLDKNNTNETPEIDDLNSPLLSAANEPLHRPIRSRRPQSLQNRVNKFNPFRILG